ncbi:hypothetical protein IFM89_040005 [Coptis chinensis]|uniref:Uncharacterized protein n=1 Tax=Coptis chinensis TaxID=261450 RepID=A0A835LBV4_9MAGN|nr:hypothetical protein IFM89_040005 [Coptis chinensis]
MNVDCSSFFKRKPGPARLDEVSRDHHGHFKLVLRRQARYVKRRVWGNLLRRNIICEFKASSTRLLGREMGEEGGKRKKSYEDEDYLSMDGDGSGFIFDSNEGMGNDNNKVEENSKNDQKRKKKGPLATNLMAERRGRKKLNDRLYMLWSVAPKISKTDGWNFYTWDVIEYLKELLQRINDLHNELESTPPGSSLPPSTSFNPLTPTPPTLPCRGSWDERREGCQHPHVLLPEARSPDVHHESSLHLGLDIQQSVLRCFDGFALVVFHAEVRFLHSSFLDSAKHAKYETA